MRSHSTKNRFRTRNRFSQLLLLTLVSLSTATAAQASVTDAQVNHLVEALRDVAQQSSSKPKTLHSDWRISEINIGPWSKKCLQREMTVEEFKQDAEAVSKIVTCVVKENLEAEYAAVNGDEALAVRRVSAWWLTGDSGKYEQSNAIAYGDRILKAYQKRNDGKPFAVATVKPGANQPTKEVEQKTPENLTETAPVELKPDPKQQPEKPAMQPEVRPGSTKKQTGPIVSVSADRSTVYDRYMLAGKQAQEAKNFTKALLFFRRALDERPNDTYALTGIQEVEAK